MYFVEDRPTQREISLRQRTSRNDSLSTGRSNASEEQKGDKNYERSRTWQLQVSILIVECLILGGNVVDMLRLGGT
jgi:hypothetical protein